MHTLNLQPLCPAFLRVRADEVADHGAGRTGRFNKLRARDVYGVPPLRVRLVKGRNEAVGVVTVRPLLARGNGVALRCFDGLRRWRKEQLAGERQR